MINLNLLSPEQKENLKTKRFYIAIKEMVMLILLFTTIIAIMLLISRYILENQLTDLISRNANAIRISQETNQKIIAINQIIEAIEKIQKDFRPWSQMVVKLAKIVPENISFSLLKIYDQSGILEIQGMAKTRQNLINFQKNLENSDWFKNINLPLANLLAKENNAFNIQATVNLEKMPQ